MTAQQSRLSRFSYGSFYLFLYIILFGLILITPGDIIERSVDNKQYFNIWILAVAYVVTTLVVCFVYITRLYVNKTVLASIPKSWLPIEKGDVKDKVYKVITMGLSRSAAISYAARPRVKTADELQDEAYDGINTRDRHTLWKMRTMPEEVAITMPSERPVWGVIEQSGWSSPNSPELPNLQYNTVLSEIPNLIEAKALTLAPPDPTSHTEPPRLDPEAVGLLQRLPNMTLRDYFTLIADLGVLEMDAPVAEFLTQYEFARFSTRPLTSVQFRDLMHNFAEILKSMLPLDPAVLDPEEEDAALESDIDNDGAPSSPRSFSRASTNSSQGSVHRPSRQRSSYRTAPNTPGGKRTMDLDMTSLRSSGRNSFAQTRHPYPISQASSVSLSSKSTAASGSVIRLATHGDPDDLPYVLSLRETGASRY